MFNRLLSKPIGIPIICKPISIQIICLLVLLDFLLSIVILWKVPYTEIDWKAYMEEVEGYLGGERDYTLIQGNTGPLVYPAGFLYIFSFFRLLTDEGRNIFTAQCIFCGIYLLNLAVVLFLYYKNGKIPAWFCALLLFSKRIHSIYMLRMFNDCIAVLFGYIAVSFFLSKHWRVGSVFYSLAVSVKMNMLLFAPGIFIVWILSLGVKKTIECIAICAIVQLVLGYPFLSTYPVSYLSKAFELTRVFFYKWTVNFKFLPEEIFLSKKLSVVLLILTVIGYLLYMRIRFGKALIDGKESENNRKRIWSEGVVNLSDKFIINTIFGSNVIGIVFARSLHYQFYCWYFHMIPLILWHSSFSIPISLIVLFGIELAFNVFPATAWSSLVLQGAHLLLLLAIFTSKLSYSEEELEESDEVKEKKSSEPAKKKKH